MSKPMVQIGRGRAKNHRDIDEQVERILQHPLFHQSRRLPAFLRYIVHESLQQGSEDSIKERILGIEVFGRNPDYDNNSDPIVRVTATELRKKLAQYYYEDGHSDEIRIELPPGSYLPRFHWPLAKEKVSNTQTADTPAAEAVTTSAGQEEQLSAVAASSLSTPPLQDPSLRHFGRIIGLTGLVLILITASVFAIQSWRQAHSPLNKFWENLVGGSKRVLIVMPVIGSDNTNGQGNQLSNISVNPNLSLEDTSIAAHIAGQIEKHKTPYQLISSTDATVDVLRTGPAVLIGALDNAWTMRLMRDIPFVFEESEDRRTGRIIDRSSGGRKSWTVDINTPHSKITHDYGIVARYTSRLTGEPVIIIAGISSQGTQAAGELLTSSEFETIRTIATGPHNFEVIIETEAIDGHAGIPRIITTKSW